MKKTWFLDLIYNEKNSGFWDKILEKIEYYSNLNKYKSKKIIVEDKLL